MPVQEKYGDGMVTGKEVSEKLWFWILMVTSSCWLKNSVRDPSNCQELPKRYIKGRRGLGSFWVQALGARFVIGRTLAAGRVRRDRFGARLEFCGIRQKPEIL